MAAKLIFLIISLFTGLSAIAQSGAARGERLNFLGRAVTVVDPGTIDKEGFDPNGPASICIEGPPQRQCYTAPEGIGRGPAVELIHLGKDMPALLFSAASGGVSGFRIHFALLRPGTGKDLTDLFLSDTEVSNQSQHSFWNDPSISAAPLFVTADYVWGPDESHYSPHRYIVSSYVLRHSSILDDPGYFLEDRYMTARVYDADANQELHVLTAERQEIIGRLRRLRIESRQKRP